MARIEAPYEHRKTTTTMSMQQVKSVYRPELTYCDCVAYSNLHARCRVLAIGRKYVRIMTPGGCIYNVEPCNIRIFT